MTRNIAFLRAVNVGKRRMEMAALRTCLTDAGLGDVETYIASGNAVFEATGGRAKLEPRIEAALAEAFGFEVETFVRTMAQLRRTVALRPFGAVPDGWTHLVAFVRTPLPPAKAAAVEAMATELDQLVVDGAELHWLIRGKSMDTGLKPKDWKRLDLGPMTTRNITMLAKLEAKFDA